MGPALAGGAAAVLLLSGCGKESKTFWRALDAERRCTDWQIPLGFMKDLFDVEEVKVLASAGTTEEKISAVSDKLNKMGIYGSKTASYDGFQSPKDVYKSLHTSSENIQLSCTESSVLMKMIMERMGVEASFLVSDVSFPIKDPVIHMALYIPSIGKVLDFTEKDGKLINCKNDGGKIVFQKNKYNIVTKGTMKAMCLMDMSFNYIFEGSDHDLVIAILERALGYDPRNMIIKHNLKAARSERWRISGKY